MEIDGDSHAVEGDLAVIPADKKQRLGIEALAQDLGEGFADPLQAGLVGGVVKGKDEHGFSAGRGLTNGAGREQKKEEREKNPMPMRVQGVTIISSCWMQRAGGAGNRGETRSQRGAPVDWRAVRMETTGQKNSGRIRCRMKM
jgi:hypothetical protein